MQADLRNALTAEKTIYTDNQAYSSKIAEMRNIEPSLDWGGRLHVVVDKCRAASAPSTAVADRANLEAAGQTFRPALDARCLRRECRLPRRTVDLRHHLFDRRCSPPARSPARTTASTRVPRVATPEAVSSLGTSWDGSSSSQLGRRRSRPAPRLATAKPRWTPSAPRSRHTKRWDRTRGPKATPPQIHVDSWCSRGLLPCRSAPLQYNSATDSTEGEHVVLRPRDAPVHVAVRRVG